MTNDVRMKSRGAVRGLMASAALAVLLGCPQAASSQEARTNDPLLDALTGQWVLRGEIRGAPTTHDVDVSWVLNHRFLRLHERSRETTQEGEPQYEADVYIGWDSAGDRYIVRWMDVYGGGFSLTGYGLRNGSAIPFVFASGEDGFRTTFAFDDGSGLWNVTMDSEHGGQLRPFARLSMTRR
jgi:hypothetical protein